VRDCDAAAPLLTVSDLCVQVERGRGHSAMDVLTDVSFDLARKEMLGIVGESGCGKTMTSLAIMGLLPRGLRITSGSVLLGQDELVGRSSAELGRIRGRRIAMIFQNAARSLNPSFPVGYQIAEVARRHLSMSRRAAAARAIEMLDLVGIPRATERARQYPHEFSGGMCQRVMIAMALACGPDVLLADEPTTALDVTVQAQVLALLRRLQEDLGLGVALVTHDLGVVAEVCDHVVVMYAGEVVEQAEVEALFARPGHPYTQGLLGAIPRSEHRHRPFNAIPGAVPRLGGWSSGCRFGPRCIHRSDACQRPVALNAWGPEGSVRCVRVGEVGG